MMLRQWRIAQLLLLLAGGVFISISNASTDDDLPETEVVQLSPESVDILGKIFQAYHSQLQEASPAVGDREAAREHQALLDALKKRGAVPGAPLAWHMRSASVADIEERPDDYFVFFSKDAMFRSKMGAAQVLQPKQDGSLEIVACYNGSSHFTQDRIRRWQSLRGNVVDFDAAGFTWYPDSQWFTMNVMGPTVGFIMRKTRPPRIPDYVQAINSSINGLQGFMERFGRDFAPSTQSLSGRFITNAEYLFQRFVVRVESSKAEQKKIAGELASSTAWMGGFTSAWESLEMTYEFAFLESGEVRGCDLFSSWSFDSSGRLIFLGPRDEIFLPSFSDDKRKLAIDMGDEIFSAYRVPNQEEP